MGETAIHLIHYSGENFNQLPTKGLHHPLRAGASPGFFKGEKMQPQITVITVSGQSYKLAPVPMERMPSNSATDWIKYQGRHIAGTNLSETEQNKVQSFMRMHSTEALTDGSRNYTLAGGMLAACFPKLDQ